MTKIQVFEHQSISYTGRYAIPEFNQKQYHALESYFQKNERTPFFDLIPKGVRFKSYVGVIQIGDLVIEVLPKVIVRDNLQLQRRPGKTSCWICFVPANF